MKNQAAIYIMSDVYRYTGGVGTRNLILCWLKHHAFRVTLFMRLTRYGWRPLRWMYRMIFSHFRTRYGVQTHPSLDVGKGFYVGHFGSIVISSGATLGDNCNVSQCVTIGAENRGKRQGYPTIGNRVWIGTNSVVVGRITIGDNVLIAPMSFVNFDVPSDSIVVGNPARIIHDPHATDRYIENTVE